MSATTSVSFVLLADHPAAAKSWRPAADESMWWGRRDSLVRITALSMYVGPATASPVCNDVIFVFNDGSSTGDKAEPAVLALVNPALVKAAGVPTEFNLVSLWKRAATDGEKQAGKVSLLSRNSGPCTCSFSPWIEARAPAGNSAGGGSSASPGLDKRTILKQLHSQCPLSFLREWKLNGSEELILKKVPKAGIDAAWAAWKQQYQQQMQQQPFPALADDKPISKLQQTFEVLLERMCLGAAGRMTLLLLHEDYPAELPVYASAASAGAGAGAGARAGAVMGTSYSTTDTRQQQQPQQPQGQGEHQVICLLGAVRDATVLELTACIAAVKARNARMPPTAAISIACCNLGRTAEFTSKICATLCLHALAGSLGAAVDAVVLSSSSSSLASPLAVANGPGSALASKLAPLRAGGWTWDGRGNKAATGVQTSGPPTLKMASAATSAALHISFALWLPFTSSAFAALIESSMTPLAAADQAQPQAQTQNLAQTQARCELQGVVQAVVCALWRSRVASERSVPAKLQPKDGAAASGAGSEPVAVTDFGGSVVPSIALVFEDGASLQLSQQAAVRLSSAHQAAPTERQVLLALQNEMKLGLTPAARGCGDGDDAEILLAALQNEAQERTAGVKTKIVDLRGVAPLVFAAEGGADKSEGCLTEGSLGKFVYRGSDDEEQGDEGGGEEDSFSLLVLLCAPSTLDPSTFQDSRLRRSVVPVRLLEAPAPPVSAGLSVTLLLQWAYSGVLLRAVNSAAADAKSRRKALRGDRRDRKRARKQESK